MNQRDIRTILLVEDSLADAEMAMDALAGANLANPVVHLEDGVDCLDYLYCRGEWAGRDPIDPAVVLLNFSGVDYINSTGIALIVGLLAKARAAHRRLIVCGLSEHYMEIFQITRLSDFMTMFPDEQSALAGAAPD